jgi:hypothetical protein
MGEVANAQYFGSLQNACAENARFMFRSCTGHKILFHFKFSYLPLFLLKPDLDLTIFVMAYDSSTMISAEAGWEFHKETIEQLYLSEDKTSGGDIA